MPNRGPSSSLLRTTHAALLFASALIAGCSSPSPYHCSTDPDCNATAGERCIAGNCAAPADTATCPSGWRYTRSAQTPDECVNTGTDVVANDAVDAVADTMTPDDVVAVDVGFDAADEDAGADTGPDVTDTGPDIVDACDMNPEICNGADDNCNGRIDEGCPAGLTFSNEQTEPLLGRAGTLSYQTVCPPGEVLTGINSASCALESLSARCSTVHLEPVSGSSPLDYTVVLTPDADPVPMPVPGGCAASPGAATNCPANQVVTSLQLVIFQVTTEQVQAVNIACSPLQIARSTTGYDVTVQAAGPLSTSTCTTTSTLSQRCSSANAVARGISGKQERCPVTNSVDSVGLVCDTVGIQLNP